MIPFYAISRYNHEMIEVTDVRDNGFVTVDRFGVQVFKDSLADYFVINRKEHACLTEMREKIDDALKAVEAIDVGYTSPHGRKMLLAEAINTIKRHFS